MYLNQNSNYLSFENDRKRLSYIKNFDKYQKITDMVNLNAPSEKKKLFAIGFLVNWFKNAFSTKIYGLKCRFSVNL